MNRQLKTLGVGALAGMVLTSAAMAQGPGGGGQGGNGGGRGGFARPTTGAVTAVDTTANTITVGGANGGAPQTIKVGADAPIAMETAGTVTDVKVGDTVNVADAAGQITITDGTLPDAFGFYGRMLTGGGGGFGGGRGGFGGGGGNAAAPAPSFSITNGKVTSASPLTISAGTGVSLTMSATTDVKVNRITTGQLSGVKVGDQVMAFGQAGADGTVTATAVAVGFPQNQGGRGGFGGRGGGGFGGGGNGGNGGNGQGGGNGGGQGGGQGANAQGGGFGGGQNGGGRRRRNRNGGGQNGGGQGGNGGGDNGGQNGGGQPMPGGDNGQGNGGGNPPPATDDNNG